MAQKFKLVKEPKPPRLPKKPKGNASVESMKKYLLRVEAMTKKHAEKVKEVRKKNDEIKKNKVLAEKLKKQISGISGIGKK